MTRKLIITLIKKEHDKYGNPLYRFKAVADDNGHVFDATDLVASAIQCRYNKRSNQAVLKTWQGFRSCIEFRMTNLVPDNDYQVLFVD